jgi:hypothetical protein
MQITIELPEEIGNQLQQKWDNLPQKILESLALEAYRQGLMTSAQIQTMLKFSSRWQTEQFLKENQAYLDYTEADLAEDLETLNNLLSE